MEANVFNLVELRERGLLGELSGDDNDLILDPIMPGETRLGPLTDDERELYKTIVALDHEIQEIFKESQARVLEHVAKHLRASKDIEDFHNRMSGKEKPHVFINEEEAEYYFETQTRFEFLRAQFNYMIRSRLGHGSAYGVRIGYEIVRASKKYELPPAPKVHDDNVLVFHPDGTTSNG